ncbi:MAG: hypothetical protein JWO37_2261 [Acidimicrobiales bacterium]|nr:hypothetical protein [Acidimicrobiales bacterium]
MTTPVRAAATQRAAAAPARRPAEGDAPRRLRVVPDGALSPRAQRRRARLLVGLVACVVVAGLFGAVFFHVLLTQGQLQLDRIQTRAAAEHARNERLRLEVAELQSPERIVAAAQQQLGMVPPASVTYLSPSGSRPAGPPATKPAARPSAAPAAKSPPATAPTSSGKTVAAPSRTTAAGQHAASPTPTSAPPATHR